MHAVAIVLGVLVLVAVLGLFGRTAVEARRSVRRQEAIIAAKERVPVEAWRVAKAAYKTATGTWPPGHNTEAFLQALPPDKSSA